MGNVDVAIWRTNAVVIVLVFCASFYYLRIKSRQPYGAVIGIGCLGSLIGSILVLIVVGGVLDSLGLWDNQTKKQRTQELKRYRGQLESQLSSSLDSIIAKTERGVAKTATPSWPPQNAPLTPPILILRADDSENEVHVDRKNPIFYEVYYSRSGSNDGKKLIDELWLKPSEEVKTVLLVRAKKVQAGTFRSGAKGYRTNFELYTVSMETGYASSRNPIVGYINLDIRKGWGADAIGPAPIEELQEWIMSYAGKN